MPPSDYKRAYESAKQELAEMIATQDRVGKRIMTLRESLKALATLCESEEVQIEPSVEAAYLLENSNLNEEIQEILKSRWPEWQRPHEVKSQLEALGHDLTKYTNPQAAIQMVLKRLVESGSGAQENKGADGKQVYRFRPMWQTISDQMLNSESTIVLEKGAREAANYKSPIAREQKARAAKELERLTRQPEREDAMTTFVDAVNKGKKK